MEEKDCTNVGNQNATRVKTEIVLSQIKCLHALGLSKAGIDTEENDPSSTKQNYVSQHIVCTGTNFLALSLSLSL